MNRRVKYLSTLLLLTFFTLSLAACGRDADKEKQAATPEKPVQQPARRPPMKTGPPLPVLPVKGKILDVLDTGAFLFIQVEWDGKPVWATVPGAEVKLGETIALDHASMIKNFHSKTLDRTFPELIFATGIIGKSPRPRQGNKMATDSNDPRNRRSGKFLAGMEPSGATPSPVPGQPVPKSGAKADH